MFDFGQGGVRGRTGDVVANFSWQTKEAEEREKVSRMLTSFFAGENLPDE